MKSKHFPEYDRFHSPASLVETLGAKVVGSEHHLANQRGKGTGFPFIRQGGRIIYDLDLCYETGLAAGLAPKQTKAA